jgi:histidine triad (HIT) family protein
MDSQSSDNCLICRKHTGLEKVFGGFKYEDDLILISHSTFWSDEQVHYLGHIFIETKRHVAEYADLLDEEARRLVCMLNESPKHCFTRLIWIMSIRS